MSEQYNMMRSPEDYTARIEQEQEENKEFVRTFKVQDVHDQRQCEALFGEIFMTSNETNGGLEMLSFFKGKLISSLGGGQQKLFVIENNKDGEGVISSLHAPEYDEYDYTFTEREELHGRISNPQQLIEAFSNKGKLKRIISGKKHMLFLTDQGTVYSWGYGEYGSLGLGGVVQCQVPRQLANIAQQKVNQIACGEYHSMVLTDQHDVYVWGKGFQGQLGMGETKTTLSIPKYLTFFNTPPADETSINRLKKHERIKYKNYVTQIACGALHSMAINYQGKLYAWGDNTTGQIGLGHSKQQFLPQLVSFQEEVQVKNVKGGYGHTVALDQKGQVFTWGFNCYGQLGNGDTKTQKYPQKLTRDILTNVLPTITKISCGYYNTFAICSQGRLYSWGGGNLGQKDEKNQKAPRKIEAHTEGRIFTDVFCNNTSTLFFAKARIISIRPESGPSSGNTMLSLVGTGFSNTGNQKVRFTFKAKKLNVFKRQGNNRMVRQLSRNSSMKEEQGEESMRSIQVEVNCDFDPVTDCYHCFTPNFDEQSEELLEWPVYCDVELTLDGQTYIQYESHFLIYSSKLQTQNISPKCANIAGGTTLTLVMPNMDAKTSSHLRNLTVGFQAKQNKHSLTANNSHVANTPPEGQDSHLNTSNKEGSLVNTRPQSSSRYQQKGAVNPLALHPEDQELEKENWICVAGSYENGKITCKVPKMEDLRSECFQFNVDVALNGQQFSGQPSSFRFYKITVDSITPNVGAFEGGLKIRIIGNGFFDTISKQILFRSVLGERIIDLEWDKQSKSYHFIQPPLSWLLAGNEPTQEVYQKVLASNIELLFSLNGVEWLNIGNFYYRVELEVSRIGHVDDKVTEEQFKSQEPEWSAEEEAKAQENDSYECQTLFKKAGSKLYIHGTTFEDMATLQARFKLNEQSVLVPAHFKNKSMLAVVVPELNEETAGIFSVEVEVTLNGIQYSKSARSFRMMVFEQGMTQDQRNKMEEAENKNLKKKK